jgi:hypothetical protein
LLRIYEKKANSKKFKIKSFLAAQVVLSSQGFCFYSITFKPKIRIL